MRCEQEVINALELYGDIIRRVCFIHLKKEVDVEDVFQNVFLKYVNSSTEFESNEHEKAWFIRVSSNECKSLLRRWFHRKVELSDDLSIYGFDSPQVDHTLLNAVLSLPENYKNVIYLHYYEGYKIQEIAQILMKKENTIHTWLRRAKDQLKDILGGDYLDETTTIIT